jgi:hypothetical protein
LPGSIAQLLLLVTSVAAQPRVNLVNKWGGFQDVVAIKNDSDSEEHPKAAD